MATAVRVVCAVLIVAAGAARASAADRFCDSSRENCRVPLINLIKAERIGIDVAFWFMEDARYSTAIIERFRAGVPVRVIVDTKANVSYPHNAEIVRRLVEAGVPIRERRSSYLHWKTMIFAGQNVVQFSGANYSPYAFVPVEPLVNFIDEVIYFTDNSLIVNSFKTRFDDVWLATSAYANVTDPPARTYPTASIHPVMNFEPWQDFGARSVGRYNAETRGIDAIMFRITDARHTDALIAARRRGVPVRIITEPGQYRDTRRYLHPVNVDRMYMAGIQIRHRAHTGWLHQKSTVLHGQGMTIFGSSNWTRYPGQLEHNIFTVDGAFYSYFRSLFTRKWTNSTGRVETRPFAPLPPGKPTTPTPANTGRATLSSTGGVTLRWYCGPFAHRYDVYLGTSSGSLTRVLNDALLGPCGTTSTRKTHTVTGLARGRQYFWRVVSRTYANKTSTGDIWSFTTQ